MKNVSLYMRVNRTIKNLSIHIAILGSVLIFGWATMSAPAVASGTPDGTTPANEGVCDGLKTNATPGLYGLCVAYCEAQDLDSFDKGPPNVKILENYNKKKQAGDPDMPCVKVPCPCWSDAELASISADGAAAACLSANSNKLQIIDNTPKTHFAEADTSLDNNNMGRCRYIDLNVTPPTVRSFSISPTEAQACYDAVSAACTSLGL